MKNKILLEICLPAVEKSFDVRIPRQLKVAQAAVMLAEFIKKQDVEYIPTAQSTLCDMENGRAFDPNAFIGDLGLHNGSKVMMI